MGAGLRHLSYLRGPKGRSHFSPRAWVHPGACSASHPLHAFGRSSALRSWLRGQTSVITVRIRPSRSFLYTPLSRQDDHDHGPSPDDRAPPCVMLAMNVSWPGDARGWRSPGGPVHDGASIFYTGLARKSGTSRSASQKISPFRTHLLSIALALAPWGQAVVPRRVPLRRGDRDLRRVCESPRTRKGEPVQLRSGGYGVDSQVDPFIWRDQLHRSLATLWRPSLERFHTVASIS
jgi:hypothetical protein